MDRTVINTLENTDPHSAASPARRGFLKTSAASALVVGFALPLAKFLKKRASGTLISGLSLSGLGLIGGAFFFLSGADPYPAWRALIPVTGAVIVLAGTGARPETLTAKSLSHSVAVRIGLVSYSWYLWHWPLLSLAVIAEIGPPGWRGVLFAGVLGYIAAELSYRFVETPVKAWRQLRAAQLGDRRIFVAGVVSAFVVSLVCGGITGLGYLKNKTWLETKTRQHGIFVIQNSIVNSFL